MGVAHAPLALYSAATAASTVGRRHRASPAWWPPNLQGVKNMAGAYFRPLEQALT
jgi:hypothetical protein